MTPHYIQWTIPILLYQTRKKNSSDMTEKLLTGTYRSKQTTG